MINRQTKIQLALSCSAASFGLLISPTFNSNFFPETRVCFKPQQVLAAENEHLTRCDSNKRVGVILTSVFRDLERNDIEFYNKVAANPITKHFDHNLNQSKLLQLAGMSLGVLAIWIYSQIEKEILLEKSRAYQAKRIEVMKNESDAYLNIYGYDSHTVALQKEIKNQTFVRDAAKLQAEAAEEDLKTAEARAKIKKVAKEGAKESRTDDTKAAELELDLDVDYLWYNRVLNEPCKVITGVSGSGKSTMEHALIQLARQDNQHTVILYPNTTRTARDNSQVLSNSDSINQFLTGFFDLVKSRKDDARAKGIDEDDYLDYLATQKGLDGKIAMFAMEVNNWEASGVDPELIAKFYKICFTDIRKWGLTLTITGQSMNQTSVASKLAGFSTLLSQQTKVECQATTCPTTGKSISKGLALVKYSDQPEPQELKLVFYKPKDKSKY